MGPDSLVRQSGWTLSHFACKADRVPVLLVLASLEGGGAERVMVTIAQHLDRKRFEPHMAVVNATGPLLNDVPLDVELHDLKARRARYIVPALLRLIWQVRPVAVLSTASHINVPVLAMRRLLPHATKVFVRENSTPSAEVAAIGGLWLKRLLYRQFYRKADAVICQSEVMLNDLCDRFDVPRKTARRIYNPVDIDRIRSLADAGANPFSSPGPHLVASGRLEHVKGFDLLLEAMVYVREAFPRAQLTVLGTGSLEQELRDRSARLNLTHAVSFVGFFHNPFPYYLNADLFVLSSRYEGLPNVMLEAMALETPVVATDCPGGIREIAEGWPNCRLALPQSVSSLAAAVIASLREGWRSVPLSPDCRFNQTSLPNAVRAYESLLLS